MDETKLNDVDLSLIIKNRICHTFIHHVEPDNVLPLLMKRSYSEQVLTNADDHAIRAVTGTGGRIKGAFELLDRLTMYLPNWFTVLLEVLRHEDVRLISLAEEFEQEKRKAYTEWLERTIVHERGPGYIRADSISQPNDQQSRSVQEQRYYVDPDSTANDFELDGGGCISEDDTQMYSDYPETEMTHDMPNVWKPKENQNLSVSANPKAESASAKDTTDDGGYEVVDVLPSGSSSKSPPRREYDEAEGIPETTYMNTASSTTGSGAKAKFPFASLEKNVRAKNDFSYGETQEALSNFEGWHEYQDDKKVMHKFKRILEKKLDGHFMVWYWEKKKRPAICVSHDGKLITYIVHRRPTEDSGNPCGRHNYYYYISKDKKMESLYELFNYYLKNGLPDMNTRNQSETIQMKNPIMPKVNSEEPNP